MKIHCIADLHGYEPELPGGDLLIVAGDHTAEDKLIQWANFYHWLRAQPYQHKIIIAGNHDNFFKTAYTKGKKEGYDLEELVGFLDTGVDFEYLCDSGTEYKGLKVWGTPWTPWFHGVNPKCKAFMRSESYLEKKFDLIPEGLDILITHGPPSNVLDKSRQGFPCGSISLKNAIDRAKPRYHVFGHMHGCGGQRLIYKHGTQNTMCINCSYLDDDYEPAHSYQRIEL